MPLAPHRFQMPDYQESLWYFHRTETSMEDFVFFTEHESTQSKMEHDFYLRNNKNRTAEDGNLIAREEMVLFKPGETYSRSITRQYLYEYYITKASWTRHHKDMKEDNARYWAFAKSIKDYIVATGKKEFKYEEIKEIIESMAILCYTNDILYYQMIDWINFIDTHLCDYE